MATIYCPENETEWLALRKNVITATEASILLGLNNWKSVAEMIDSKENGAPLDNSYIWLGQVLENVVVQAVNKQLGSSFKLFEEDGVKRFFVKEDLKLGATPDAYQIVGDSTVLLECKSTKPGNALRYAFWPPAYYLMQLYVQMFCLDVKEGVLAIMSTNMTQKSETLKLPLSLHTIKRDDWIDNTLQLEVARYWDCTSRGKQYRVNRKQALVLELKLRML